jgi:energy-coupling factor transporter ATP-binding protein EcfA2
MVIIPKNVYQKKNIIVLIAGKAGAGKSTVADFMLRGLPTDKPSMISSFALGIKSIAYQMGWNGEKDEKGRRLLQQLGNMGREYNENTWVKHTMDVLNRMTNPIILDFLLVDDWRFPNEYQWFFDRSDLYSVYSVRVHRDESELLNAKDTDVSETSLPDDFDYYAYNIVNKNLDMDELNARSRYVLQQIIDTEFSYED